MADNWQVVLAISVLLNVGVSLVTIISAFNKPQADKDAEYTKEFGTFKETVNNLVTALNGVTIKLNMLLSQFDKLTNDNASSHERLNDILAKLDEKCQSHEVRITLLESKEENNNV